MVRPGQPVGQPASSSKPKHPDPQSQSLSRSYGSNLPTSLTYIVLSTRGCAPWRPAADMGTAWHENYTVSVGFSRADTDAPDTARAAVLYGNPVSLSPGKPIPGSESLTKKRELFPGSAPTSPTSFALPHMAPKDLSPCPGSGILTRFPFDPTRAQINWLKSTVLRFRTEFSYLLGPTDPCSTAVHMEPFSTSVFKVLV